MLQEGAVLEQSGQGAQDGEGDSSHTGIVDNLFKKVNGINTYDVFFVATRGY